MSAIIEDYGVLLKSLDFQAQVLEELERLDKYNPFLKKNSVEDIKKDIIKYTQESEQFSLDLKEAGKETESNNVNNQDQTAKNTESNNEIKKMEDKDSVFI